MRKNFQLVIVSDREVTLQKVSKSVTGEIEQMVVSKSVGKLTIMKHLKEAEKNSSGKCSSKS